MIDNVRQGSSRFVNVHQLLSMFVNVINVRRCSSMPANGHQRSSMFANALQCSLMFVNVATMPFAILQRSQISSVHVVSVPLHNSNEPRMARRSLDECASDCQRLSSDALPATRGYLEHRSELAE